jgi:2-polyprenyl-6-methoxyphenol hydroxylase-like FAD-dependent oxidoreductase
MEKLFMAIPYVDRSMQDFKESSVGAALESTQAVSFAEKMAALKCLRKKNMSDQLQKPTVAILGAAVSGFMHAILALINGNKVSVFEMRKEEQEGRKNAIILSANTISVLKEYGIYHYLREHKLFGSSFDETRFPLSISLKDIESAMKAVIKSIASEQILFYQTQLDRIKTTAKQPVDLVIKTANCQKRIFGHIDILVVAEGTKSATCKNILKTRRVEVFPAVPAIGGIFKTACETGKSFSYNLQGIAAGTVLYTPGLASIGCLPLSENAEALKELSKHKDSEKDKKQFFQELTQQAFRSDASFQQKMPSFESDPFITTTNMFSDFTLPFCGKVGEHTRFFVTGDALSQVDAISGKGANKAVQSATNILPALQSTTFSEKILNDYAAKTVEKLAEVMDKIKYRRTGLLLGVDENAYNFALLQLKHHRLVEKIQKIVGITLSKLFFNSKLGETCFRYLVEKISIA